MSRPLRAAVLAGATLLALAGCGAGAQAPATATSERSPSPDSPSARFGADASGPSSTAVPVRVRIPSIGVSAPVGPLELAADGELSPPVRPDDAGWYTGSAVPGEVGPAVIAGHVDSASGPAVFHRLGRLRPGAIVEVVRSDETTARFTVVRIATHPKARFPTDAVYGPTPDRALRLITCAGPYDRDGIGYRDNVVVYALQA